MSDSQDDIPGSSDSAALHQDAKFVDNFAQLSEIKHFLRKLLLSPIRAFNRLCFSA
jgi:hypothetical protein